MHSSENIDEEKLIEEEGSREINCSEERPATALDCPCWGSRLLVALLCLRRLASYQSVPSIVQWISKLPIFRIRRVIECLGSQQVVVCYILVPGQ